MLKTLKLLKRSSQLVCSRFSTNLNTNQTTSQETTPTSSNQESVKDIKEKEEIPVHLRPYNKSKYEVPSSKIKVLTSLDNILL